MNALLQAIIHTPSLISCLTSDTSQLHPDSGSGNGSSSGNAGSGATAAAALKKRLLQQQAQQDKDDDDEEEEEDEEDERQQQQQLLSELRTLARVAWKGKVQVFTPDALLKLLW